MNNLKKLEQYKRELMREHAEEIAAVDRLLARERSKVNGAADTTTIQAETPVVTARRRRRMSNAAMVWEGVQQIRAGEDFTRENVQRHISQRHPATELDSRAVGVELWHLADKDQIHTVRMGKGRIPAVYRR